MIIGDARNNYLFRGESLNQCGPQFHPSVLLYLRDLNPWASMCACTPHNDLKSTRQADCLLQFGALSRLFWERFK